MAEFLDKERASVKRRLTGVGNALEECNELADANNWDIEEWENAIHNVTQEFYLLKVMVLGSDQ